MVVDPWSVSPEAIDQLAVQFFGASLFPYLAFLYFLNRKEVECPPVANFGFRFLLVFVFATIPAGIYAKQAYGTILANVDWLHGTAESLLTITNLLIVVGFRQALASNNNEASPISSTASASDKDTNVESTEKLQASPLATTASILLPIAVQTVAAATAVVFSFPHVEPSNALSLPTWIVHASSLLEWLAAMALVWEYAEATGRPQWKGLVWAMLPLHTSGICACTYHLFYNAPALNGVVALQAGLTCFGNVLMAFAVWRIVQASAAAGTGKEELQQQKDQVVQLADTGADGQGSKAQLKLDSQLSNGVYYGRLAVGTVALSAAVKWGSLAVDWPFNPTLAGAAALITAPTALNMVKWAVRSKTGKKLLGGLL